jgi:hypothetical protein
MAQLRSLWGDFNVFILHILFNYRPIAALVLSSCYKMKLAVTCYKVANIFQYILDIFKELGVSSLSIMLSPKHVSASIKYTLVYTAPIYLV